MSGSATEARGLKILALVLARGGSKRVPGKNLRSFGGRPLLLWSTDVAKGLPEISDVMVSTDAQEIADTARAAGALVPWLRPAELATDTAPSADVCLHALDWYEREREVVDGLLLLQPTSPLRRRESVTRGIGLFGKNDRRPVIGLSPARSHPALCFTLEGDSMRSFLGGKGLGVRSQDLPPAYLVNGAFFLIAPHDLRARRSFYSDDSVPLLMGEEEGIDIDTELDWAMAECALKGTRSGKE